MSSEIKAEQKFRSTQRGNMFGQWGVRMKRATLFLGPLAFVKSEKEKLKKLFSDV